MKINNLFKGVLTALSIWAIAASTLANQPVAQSSWAWIPGHWYSGYWIPGQYVACRAPVGTLPAPNSRYHWNGSGGWRR